MVVTGFSDDTPGASDHVGLGIVRYEDDPTDVTIDRSELCIDFIPRG